MKSLAPLLLVLAVGLADDALAPGVWSQRGTPDGWLVVERGAYQFQSRLPRATTDALAEHVAAMGALYDTVLRGRSTKRRVAVKLFDHGEAFVAYGGVQGLVAYADLDAPELVAFDEGVVLGERHVPTPARLSPSAVFTGDERDAIGALLERVGDEYLHDVGESLAHEAWHVHVDTVLDRALLPLWLDEGLADVFAVADPSGDAPQLDAARTNPERLRRLRRAVLDRATIPLEEFVRLDARRFARDRELSYAMSWGLTHFLLHHDDPARRDIPREILTAVAAKRSRAQAVSAAFDDVDFDQLEREFAVWVRRLPNDDPLDELAERFGDRLRADDLTAPEHVLEAYTWARERR